MARIPGIRRAFRFPFRSRERLASEVDEELTFHLDMKARELVAAGVPADEARRRARDQFGDLEYTRRYMRANDRRAEREVRRIERLDELRQDARYAWRQMRRNPGYATIALVTLALGIGANTAIFSVVNGVLLRALPYDEPDALVRILSTTPKGRHTSVSPRDFLDWRMMSRSFTGIAAAFESTVNLTGAGEPERFTQARVSANTFDILGVRAAIGRTFAEGEDDRSAPRVAVLSDGLWRRRFGADRTIIGRVLTLDGYATEIIGVAPPEMRYPGSVDVWMTTRFDETEVSESSRGARWVQVLARRRPGVSIERARLEMTEVARRLERHDPQHNTGVGARVVTLRDQMVGNIRPALLVLLAAVGFVLLIACANVASLTLGRSAARETELAVRTALGAGRGRLVRQLLTENVCLSLLGGALGLALSVWGTRLLVTVAPGDIPRLHEVHADAAVIAFTVGVTLLTALLFGLVPALHASASDLHLRLKEGARGSGGRRTSARTRGALVVSEMALALVLLAGAGLLMRSFVRLSSVDGGFRAEGVSTFSLTVSQARYADLGQVRTFASSLLERLQQIPGVERVGLSFALPLTGNSFSISFTVDGRPEPKPNDEPSAQTRVASPDYFATMGIPLLRGRPFTDADRDGSPAVLLISQETARRFWPDENPIGQRIVTGWGFQDKRLAGEIVGIVGDVRQHGLDGDPVPHVYAPYAQWPIEELTFVVQSRRRPEAVLAAARTVVSELDRDLPLFDAYPLSRLVAGSLGQPRFYLLLLAVFAATALALAAVGIYGVLAYAVQQRTREIGIRIALGATRERVLHMVVRQGLGLAALGIILGVAGASALTRVMRTLLFGVSATDPTTFILVALLLALVALVACVVPARRAARVDPLVAIRD